MVSVFFIVSGSLLLLIIGAGIYALRNLYFEEKKVLLYKESLQKLKELQKQANMARAISILSTERIVKIDEVSVSFSDPRFKRAGQKPLHIRDNDTMESFEYQF